MGVPLLANSQLGTFYPPNWLVAPLSAPDGVRVSILLHVLWAGLGAYALARAALRVGRSAALTGAALFAFGGFVGAHVEQINQLQGLAWMPWLFLGLARACERPARYIPLLAMGLALQIFTGHTQTVFITGLGLGVYALLTRPVRGLVALALAFALALVLAAPQLIPTLELTNVSNRHGGMTPEQATAFSFSPFVAGRGLLPSYDTLIFGEYVAYLGVIGLGLAILGALQSQRKVINAKTERRRGAEGGSSETVSAAFRLRAFALNLPPSRVWLIIALIGLALAFGLYNPLYWTLASLPGFNLFRVPARWLALFALGAALLAALGAQRWLDGERPRALLAAVGLVVLLGVSTVLVTRNPDGTPSPPPSVTTIIGWGAALAAFVLLQIQRNGAKTQVGARHAVPLLSRSPVPLRLDRRGLLVALVGLELFLASFAQPYNDLAAPEAYSAQRFSISQLRAYNADDTPPGRFLSISNLLFDPGDRAALEARYRALGLSETSIRHAFVAIKMKEVLAANLPLAWGIPTIDGFDGGVLPTAYYTAFTALLLPPDELRTVDGRLREILARESCRGACLPDQRWLNLTNTRYLLTDKVYDVVQDGIFYDTQFASTLENSLHFDNPTAFEADALYLLCSGGCNPTVTLVYADGASEVLERLSDEAAAGFTLAQYRAAQPTTPARIEIAAAESAVGFVAATLVDTRTGDFIQLAPQPWTRVLSSDIKLYENGAVLPRALVVYDSFVTPDTEIGTEAALDRMRAPDFDPARMVVLASNEALTPSPSPKGETALTPSPSPSGEIALTPSPSPKGRGESTEMLSEVPLPLGEGFRVRADGVRADGADGAHIASYTPEQVTLQVTAARAGYLLLTDAYYPGWTATVNGQPAPIYRADIMFRAVPVPEGESEVVFAYRPAWLPGALLLGGMALAFAIAVTRVGYKKFT